MKPPFKTIIVDDKQSEIDSLVLSLRRFPSVFDITATANAYEAALQKFKEEYFDVAIIDYELDGAKDCIQLIDRVSVERRKITVFKTTTNYANLLEGLYRDKKILFISSFYTEELIDNFVENLITYYKENFPPENKLNFLLKGLHGESIVTPVSHIYLMETLKRENTIFYLIDERGKYRSITQSGRMQNHIATISNSDLVIPTRGYCVNIRHVKKVQNDQTLVFNNASLLPSKFPSVKVANDRLEHFLSLLLK